VTICTHIRSPPQVRALDSVAAGGVIFWASNNDNYYLAQIYPGGGYAIYRRFSGTWINLVPRTKNAYIKSGINAINEISVVLVNNLGAMFINNVKVQEFRGQPPRGGGAVGLYAQSETSVSNEWRFFDIAVMDNGKSKPVVLPPAPSGPTIVDCRPVNSTDFQDTFQKPDPGWGSVAHYVDGQLAVNPNENGYYIQLYRPLVFKNSTVCMTVKSPLEVTNLEDKLHGGLIFWASDPQNFYEVAIYPNGTFGVFRRVNGESVPVLPRTASDAIKKGVGAVNELQVVLNNNRGMLYINGVQVQGFPGQPPKDGGAVGVYAESESQQQNEWKFLNITVVENK